MINIPLGVKEKWSLQKDIKINKHFNGWFHVLATAWLLLRSGLDLEAISIVSKDSHFSVWSHVQYFIHPYSCAQHRRYQLKADVEYLATFAIFLIFKILNKGDLPNVILKSPVSKFQLQTTSKKKHLSSASKLLTSKNQGWLRSAEMLKGL